MGGLPAEAKIDVPQVVHEMVDVTKFGEDLSNQVKVLIDQFLCSCDGHFLPRG